jgi:hypothetical protein
MSYFIRISFLIVGLLFFTAKSWGQTNDRKLISGNFSQQTWAQFVSEVEAQTHYRFYYDPAQFDSLTVNLQLKEQTLEQALQQLFEGKDFSKGFRFAIDANKRVYLTKEQEIRTALPKGFFDRKERTGADEDTVTATYVVFDKKEKLKAAIESKLYEIGTKTNPIRPGNSNLAGYVRDVDSGEPVIGAAVYIDNPRIGVVTDQFGYYSMTIPRGKQEILVKSIGMKDAKRRVVLYSDGKLDIQIQEDVVPLKEVLIEAEKDVNVAGLQMGLEKLDIKTMKQVPTAFGEGDILKVILTLPGVKSVGEGSTGFNVRGGSTDQNLILFNDATIYNPSHLFGFFSAFNPDVLKNVELYKSSIPSKYGGRLASVLEVTTREGNKKKIAGAGGIGLMTGRLTLEGPIIKDKTSFILGGRTTYSDWILKNLDNKGLRNSHASFYDVNLHISHEFNEKNSLYLSAYLSKDGFKLNSDTLYNYKNQNATLKWKHVFNNQLYGVLTSGFSRYQYSVTSDKNPVNAYTLDFDLSQTNLKADFNYFPNSKHTIDFGFSSIFYKLFPGSYQPNGTASLVKPDVVPAEQALESALYIGDRYDVSALLSLSFGLRYSLFNYLGPQNVATYASGLPKETSNVQGTTPYASGAVIKTYHGPEYRVSARYALNEKSSVKLSFNSLRQYIHMLSNTTAISPTDIWKLSDSHIQPQLGNQVSLGLYKNFKANTIETSLEVYYKKLDNYLDYKSGDSLILNHHIEAAVINTRGKSYGVELMVKKLSGKLNGWISYTYSRSLRQMNDVTSTELINHGQFYPSNFDKPHDFTMIGNYRFSRRFSISLNFTYSTGRPITLPLAKYTIGGSERVYYSDRNQYRIPDYYRADLSMNFEGNHRVKKLAHSSWTFAIYNLTGRKNAYSVYFTSDKGMIKGHQLSIFGQPIPTITYNFRF